MIIIVKILKWLGQYPKSIHVVATTHRNGTHSLLTSAKLLVGYLVVGITRELNKEPSLHCSSIYINTKWSVLQQYYSCPNVHALSSCPITHPHVFSIRPPCFLHVSWRYTFNLRCTCAHHMYTMRNPCPLMSLLTLTPSRLFPILLDPKSFQTVLDSITWLPGHVLSIRCRLIITTVLFLFTNPNPKVCPHTRTITI